MLFWNQTVNDIFKIKAEAVAQTRVAYQRVMEAAVHLPTVSFAGEQPRHPGLLSSSAPGSNHGSTDSFPLNISLGAAGTSVGSSLPSTNNILNNTSKHNWNPLQQTYGKAETEEEDKSKTNKPSSRSQKPECSPEHGCSRQES